MCQRVPKDDDDQDNGDDADRRAQDERIRQLEEERTRLAREDAEVARLAREAAAEAERLRVLFERKQMENERVRQRIADAARARDRRHDDDDQGGSAGRI